MIKKGNKIIFYGFPFFHHKGTMGGYHHIKEYLTYDIIIDLDSEKYLIDVTLNKNFTFKVVKKLYLTIFKRIGFLQLIRCSILAIFKKNYTFHFIYPENTYAWLHNIKNQTNKIACTFHQPPNFYANSKRWQNIIKSIDLIIVLNKSDVIFFKSITMRDNVYYLPHGVNTSFFKFDINIRKENRVIMVGNWLRNFELARKLFLKINKNFPNIIIDIVVNNENKFHFTGLNVKLHTNISDLDLKILYQKSKIAFFPLYDFTANNSMLEAMACGTSILVATDKKYKDLDLPNEFLSIVPNDDFLVYEKFTDLFFSNKNDYFYYLAMSKYCNENYSWNIVAKNTKIILNSIP